MDSIISSSNSGVIKLEGQRNWIVWKFQITVLLKGLGIFSIVDGTTTKPEEEVQAQDWIKKDGSAQSLIVTRLTESTMAHIVTCETAADMWRKLLSIYEQKSESSIHLVQQRFFSYKYEEGMEISVFVSKVQELASQLKSLGEKVSDNFIMTKILMSLPEKFKYFMSAWESVAENSKTIDNLVARLISEEERMTKSEETVALVGKEVNLKIKCYGCNKFGHIKKDCTETKEVICFYCKKSGHVIKNCRIRIAKEEREGKEDKTNAFIVTAKAFIGGSENDKWFVDSGATEHICYMKSLFTEYSKLSEEKVVVIGDGTRHKAVGVGKIKLEVFNGQSWIATTLYNVLFVPSMIINLFSVRCATDKGYVMMTDKDKCQFIKNNEIGAIAVRSGKLYEMKFRYLPNLKNDVIVNVGKCSTTLSEWHEKLAHQNMDQVKKILKKNNIEVPDGENISCIGCLKGKQHRSSFGKSDFKSTKVGELIHVDVCGPMENKSIGNSRYFLLIKDDWSNYRTVYFMQNKLETIGKLKIFVKLAENETGNKIKIIRSDNGTEFINKEARKLFEENGIKHQTTVSYTPEQNGKAEREMRTLVEAARTMIQAKDMEKCFWAEAVNTAAFVINRTGKSKLENKTPYEVWSGRKFDMSNLKVFGSKVFVHTPKQKRLKWDAKGEEGIFLGYGENTKGYRIYLPSKRSVEIKRDVTFIVNNTEESINNFDTIKNQEEFVIQQEIKLQEDDKLPEEIVLQEEETLIQSDASENEQFFSDLEEEAAIEDEPKKRNRKLPYWIKDYVTSFISMNNEPKTYAEAMARDDSEKWSEAVEKELEVLRNNNVWIEDKLPKDKTPISSKWIFKIKSNRDGDVTYKARLVARGFEQQDNLDESEIYSPVAKLTTVRVFIADATMLGLLIHQMDVKGAFLYGKINEDVYMLLPDGVQCNSKIVKLQKSIYGLKKSPRYWNETFDEAVTNEGFIKSMNDHCLYILLKGSNILYLLLYVDDLLLCGNDENEVSRVKSILKNRFEMKDLGLVSDFLGINIQQNVNQKITILKQSNYLQKILEKFDMTECKEMLTPMDQKFKFDLLLNNNNNKYLENKCRQLIGSLMYAVSGSRPDLCAAVSFLSRYQVNANEQLYKALKRILRYVKATLNMNLVYKCNDNDFIVGYVDADWGGDCNDRKSTSGYCFKVFGCTVSWSCKKQACVTLSSTEAEYVALSMAVSEACWLKNLLLDFKIPNVIDKPVIIYEDNQSAIKVAKNPEHHKRLKHIDIKYHFIREKVAEGLIDIKYINTQKQIADMFTKPLGKELFVKFREECGLELL